MPRCAYRAGRRTASAHSAMLRPAASSAPRLRIRAGVWKEQLLPVDLVRGDRVLSFARNQPIDELLPEVALDVRMLDWIDKHDAVLVEQSPVAFDDNREVAAILERQPGSAIRENVGAHRGCRVERRPHSGARVAIPRPFRFIDVDAGVFPIAK